MIDDGGETLVLSGAPASLAESLLAACDGSLEMAVNMHMESVESDPAANSPREDLDDVSGPSRPRAPARRHRSNRGGGDPGQGTSKGPTTGPPPGGASSSSASASAGLDHGVCEKGKIFFLHPVAFWLSSPHRFRRRRGGARSHPAEAGDHDRGGVRRVPSQDLRLQQGQGQDSLRRIQKL